MTNSTINAVMITQSQSQHMLIFAVSIAIVVLMLSGGKIFFKGMQQRGYQSVGYLNWISKSNNRFMYRLSNVCLFSMVAYITFSVIFAPFSGPMFSFLGLVFFYVFSMVFFKTNQLAKIQQRQKVEYTSRLKRLTITFAVLVYLLSIGVFYGMNALEVVADLQLVSYYRYIPICIFPLLLPFLVLFANWINSPFEKLNIARYGKKARQILKENEVKVVAVTGSFGKTTTKDLIASLLGEKYIVASAPKSYNTPSGVALTVQNYVTDKTEFAVLEMGARKVGDIAYLCKIAPPNYAVITSVGMQHMESFKTFENVKKTKNELVESVESDGICFFNGSDEGAKELYNNVTKEKYCIGESDSDLVYEIIKVDQDGSKFTVVMDGEKHEFTAKLLGRHNVENVALAILVAYKLGVEIDVLQSAVSKLEATEHRLQMTKKEHAIVIDDSYNSNLKGAKYAAEVLSMFEGRKILVTPGLVELGKMEDEANRELGRIFGKVCDKIILVGNMRAVQITEGLQDVGFDFENIIAFENFNDAKSSLYAIMKKGDVVLFENDIPDSYL
ncbi:MAG: UDP-N-acetylmuramoyl-tripeptide--D-alanyl-D-alanine ligase [Bacillota bacterium]